jgi:hypothetical protein
VVLTNPSSRWLANELVDTRESAAIPEFDVVRAVEALAFSDHAPFWSAGRDAILLIESPDIQEHAPHYHRFTDTIENSYSRGGSQVKKTAELVVELVEGWTAAGPPALDLSPDALFLRTARRTDAPIVEVGEGVEVRVGITNHGGIRNDPWSVEVAIEIDGRLVESLGSVSGTTPFPPGAHETLSFFWVPSEDQAGAPRVRARLNAPGGTGLGEITRTAAVEGERGAIHRAYAYPNPTRLPGSAAIHYELARGGPVRLTLLDVRGQEIARFDQSFDPVFPDPGVDVGGADVPLRDLLAGRDLAPGLYLIRIELFNDTSTGSVEVEVVRLAVIR